MTELDEKTFRAKLAEVYERVETAFEDVDPDVVEAETSQGSLTITTVGGKKLIISAQPPVRQIWLAAAAFGIAIHFNWNEESGKWLDDRGEGLELINQIESLVEKSSGLKVSISES